MKQLSLVALYGAKPPGFEDRVRGCQGALRAGLPAGVFAPYLVGQVHATIAGLERLEGRAPPVNRNLWRKRRDETPMDFGPLREVVARHLPMSVRFGGFGPASRDFASRGATPYERSFEVQPARGTATLIGWPHRGGDFGSRALAALRADLARRCRIEHKYDDDNDLFLVLGTLSAGTARLAGAIERIVRTVRDRLAAEPLELALTSDRIHVACYESESLDPATTTAYALDDPRFGAELLAGLYDS